MKLYKYTLIKGDRIASILVLEGLHKYFLDLMQAHADVEIHAQGTVHAKAIKGVL